MKLAKNRKLKTLTHHFSKYFLFFFCPSKEEARKLVAMIFQLLSLLKSDNVGDFLRITAELPPLLADFSALQLRSKSKATSLKLRKVMKILEGHEF